MKLFTLLTTLAIVVTCVLSHEVVSINDAIRMLNANDLKPATRVFKPEQLRGTMLYQGSLKEAGIQCQASTILHEEIQPVPSRSDVFWVPHSRIVQDGQRCGTGRSNEYMLIVSGQDLLKKAVAEKRGLGTVYSELLSNKRGLNAFSALHAIDHIHLGFEITAHRFCGGRVVYSRGTVFLFVSSAISKLNLGFASLRRGQIAMISVLNNQNLCAYQDDFVDNKLNIPTPSMSPPGPVSPAPSGAFRLTAPDFSDSDSDPHPPVGPTPSASPVAKKELVNTSPPKVSEPAPAKKTPTVSSSPKSKPKPTSKAPKVSPTASRSPAPSLSTRSPPQNKACFPNNALVELHDGKLVPISGLQVGDRVRTGRESYSPVFMFTHKDVNLVAEFVVLSTVTGHTIELSDGHYIEANGVMKLARDVDIGDSLTLCNGLLTTVERVGRKTNEGLHNPQTLDGNIVVNGVVVSTFTEVIYAPSAASILTPIRAVYRMGIWTNPFYKTFWNSDFNLPSWISSCFLQQRCCFTFVL